MCEASEWDNVINTYHKKKKKKKEDAELMECCEDLLQGLSWWLSNEDCANEEPFYVIQYFL